MIREGFDVGVAAAVVRGNSVLLVQEARGAYEGRWGLPKGYVDPDESIENAVLRELKEKQDWKELLKDSLDSVRQKPLKMLDYSSVIQSPSKTKRC